jgi:flagellar motor protein MotB
MREERDGINIWLAYADLFAGMLIVFAVFYGLELAKARRISEELENAQYKATTLLKRVEAKINERYKGTDKEVKSDGTQLVLPSDITFQFGSYRIREESKTWLLEVGSELRKALDELGGDRQSVTIEIRGHTDAYPVKIGQALIPTNWELSSRRATEIVRLFQDNALLDPAQFRVVAVGAAEFEELEKNFRNGVLRDPAELESLRKIQIRILPNYEEILRNVSAKRPIESRAR